MSSFLEYLESFNRKERFFLIGYALGKPKFELSPVFREALGKAAGMMVPENALAFMDYHLDWIHASAFYSRPDTDSLTHHKNQASSTWNAKAVDAVSADQLVGKDVLISTGTQEDIDLVVAFETDGSTELLLVEAKGVTGWTNKQLQSKADRLGHVFGDDGTAVTGVHPTFVLASPAASARLDTSGWPAWMKPRPSPFSGVASNQPCWMELTIPTGRRQMIGCDDKGRPSFKRPFFRLIP